MGLLLVPPTLHYSHQYYSPPQCNYNYQLQQGSALLMECLHFLYFLLYFLYFDIGGPMVYFKDFELTLKPTPSKVA
jgi:ABC-type polysaccharide transport system permease subunit